MVEALAGALPVVYLAKVEKHRKKGLDIFGAIEEADQEIREEQAAAAPPPAEGQVIAPEQAMGLAGGPETVAAQGAPAGQRPPPPEQMQQMARALRG